MLRIILDPNGARDSSAEAPERFVQKKKRLALFFLSSLSLSVESLSIAID